MKAILTAAAVLALAGCQTADQSAPIAAVSALGIMAGTSWSFTAPGAGEAVATFGTDGRYYDVSGGKIIETGTFVTKDGHVCENVDRTPGDDNICWTVPATLPAIGEKLTTTSNKGETLTATRLEFQGNAPAR